MGDNLKSTIGLSAALSTVIGMVIGSGVFFKPQAIYSATNGAPGLGMLAWIIGGIITITAGLTAAEISSAIPKTGGMMTYLSEIYGERLGFLTGWMQTVLYFPGSVAALAVIFAQQVSQLMGYGPQNMKTVLPVALGIIVFIALLNTVGSSFGGFIQTIATVCKLFPLILIIVFGFIKGVGNPIISPMVGPDVTIAGSLGQVLIATLFAYDGWINVGAIAGEMKNPGKNLPLAIVGGLSIVMAIYILINLAYLWVVPASELANSVAPAALVARKLFGPVGGNLITLGILISVFGALNGYLLTAPRVPYVLAKEGLLPGSAMFSKLNKGGSPYNAIWLIAGLGCIYALSGQFNLLSDLTIFIVWVFYLFTFYGVIKLRKEKPDMIRPYKVPLYPLIPFIAMTGGVFVVINQLINSTMISMGGILVTSIGIPVYIYKTK